MENSVHFEFISKEDGKLWKQVCIHTYVCTICLSVCCVMQSVRVLVTCCGIVLHNMLVLRRSAFMLGGSLEIGLSAFRVLIVLRSHLMS